MEPTSEPTTEPTTEPTSEPTPTPEKKKLGEPVITWATDGKSVSWTAVDGATGYKCYRVKANGEQSSMKTVTETMYTFKNGGEPGDIFYVKAIDSTGTYEEIDYSFAKFE